MPGKLDSEGLAGETCRRCKEPALLVVRKEPLCRSVHLPPSHHQVTDSHPSPCFIRYVNTKAIKRMESFRVRNADPNKQRKILLPMSFGVSSVALLNVLDFHLKSQQEKTGRTGYSITVMFVDTRSIDPAGPSPDVLTGLKERFPNYEYASVAIQDVFTSVAPDDSLFSLLPSSDVREDASPLNKLSALMNSLPSASARADTLPILRTRLLVAEAHARGCECILWGDSTTKLAEKTLSETAKGRGFSLPWQISDGESPAGFGLAFNYPARDLLKKELAAYVHHLEPSLSSLVHEGSTAATQASMSSRNTTIDDLMKQYFESVEENFPSIVANVVRTSSKLEAKPVLADAERCSLCQMPVTDGRFGIHGWGGDQQDGLSSSASEAGRRLCYGCTRSMPRAA